MRDVRQIIKDAGGPAAISAASMRSKKFRKIEAKSCYDWTRLGIAEKNWPLLMSLVDITAHELHEANKQARAARGRDAQGAKAA